MYGFTTGGASGGLRGAPCIVIPPKAGTHGGGSDDVAHLCRCHQSRTKTITPSSSPPRKPVTPAKAGVTGLRRADGSLRSTRAAGCVLTTPGALFDALEELPEQRLRIVRSRCGLGVVLDGEHRQGAMPQAFYRLVVQVHVRHRELGCAGNSGIIAFHREAVVLGRDQNAARRNVEHRMVAAPMTVRHLRRRAAEGEADELMAEADAE